MPRTQLAALALAAVTLASGCGGSSKATRLTSAELIAKADAICARVHAEFHANGYSSLQSMALRAPRVAADEQTGARELRELTPPAAMADDWKQIVENAEAIAAETAKLGEDAKHDTLAELTPMLNTGEQRDRRVLAIAARDGFKQCAKAS